MQKNSSLQEPASTEATPLPTIDDPNAVRDFFRRTDTEALAEKSMLLVREVFPCVETIRLEVSRDPEERSEWLVVQVTARGNQQALTDAYREYVARWVGESPPDKRHFVRLSYSGA